LKYQKNIKNFPIDVDISDSVDADKWSQRMEIGGDSCMGNGGVEEAPVGDPALWTSEELFKAECVMQEITVQMSENIRRFMGLFESEGGSRLSEHEKDKYWSEFLAIGEDCQCKTNNIYKNLSNTWL
jgi:hypothetical protein